MSFALAPYVALAGWLELHKGARAVAGFTVTVAALLLLLTLAGRTWRRTLWFHLPFYLLSLAFAAYTLLSGQLPGDPIAYVLVTSSFDEVRGFFTLPLPKLAVVILIASTIAYAIVAVRCPRNYLMASTTRRLRLSLIGAFAVVSGFAATDSFAFLDGATATPAVGTALFLTGPLRYARTLMTGAYIRKLPYSADHISAREIHIFVLGESSRRDSWSGYGYARRTTPYLDSLRGETVFLSDAIADANSTVYAVPMLLTGIPPDTYRPSEIRGSLVDLAKEAGYFTCWLVNQDAWVSHLLGINADSVKYPYILNDTATHDAIGPDAVILPELDRELARPGVPLFIGIHSYGSHWRYSDRYPAAFALFGSESNSQRAQRVLDSYDNSVLYSDWFLDQIIERARKLDVPATVTYVSDHGEDLALLDGHEGHGFGTYTPHAFHIPAFIWMNAAYRQAHPDRVRALVANASKEVRSHDFFYTVADIMGVRWPGFKPERSFVSPSFVPDVRQGVLAGGNLVSKGP